MLVYLYAFYYKRKFIEKYIIIYLYYSVNIKKQLSKITKKYDKIYYKKQLKGIEILIYLSK